MGRLCVTGLIAAVVCGANSSAFSAVEARKGKRYLLDKRHGPWMIMVVSLHNRPGKHSGLTAEQAADRLVFELRRRGVPAYFYKQDSIRDRNKLRSRTGNPISPPFISRHGNISVLAGNYGAISDKVAQRTLKYVKETFRANFLADSKNGAVFKKTPGQPHPTSGAFLTINPLLSPREVARRTRDPLVRQLNVGQEYTLLQNASQYTLLVKTYYGKTEFRNAGKKSTFLDTLGRGKGTKSSSEYGSNLDRAGYNAWLLAKELRRQGHPAYVYHDKFKSMVTIGGFNSANDPRIRQYAAKFGARQQTIGGRVRTVAYIVSKPAKPGQAYEDFVLDPSPSVMEVPD